MSRLKLATVLERSQLLGHIGPGSVGEHIQHSRAHLGAANPPEGSRWCDLGTGGGLPGLVVGHDRPDLHVVLLDRSTRRTRFLKQAVLDLGIEDHVEVVTGDVTTIAHQPSHRNAYDGVLSRSFGGPAITAECAAGLLKLGGRVIVSEPPDPSKDRWPLDILGSMGFREPDFVAGPPRVASISLIRYPSVDLPRTWAQLSKNPRF